MADYVLVHGAWGGNHSYGEVPARLEAAGHRVINCTLRGLGTRQDELHPGITLSDHVDDVCEQVEAAGFDRFILAGHSYGGMVITGVAGRLGKRIDAICYIDAFLPDSDQSLWDLTGDREHNWYVDSQRHNPGMVTPIWNEGEFRVKPGIRGYQPLLTLLEAIPLSGDEQAIARKAYIFATGYSPTPFPRFAAKAQEAGFEYHETDCDHYVMTGDPDLTVKVLLGLAD